ncbi:MAG: hypothetical protein HQ523_02550 [Lentisphaerae bacterium]|nr:hypothetical protein [Lentisphaerota bacterium]
MNNASNTIATFTVSDHLAHRWCDELVGFEIADPPEGAYDIVDEEGQRWPCQIDRSGDVPRACFIVDDLAPLGTRTYALVDSAADADPFVVDEGGQIEVGNGLISVRLPSSQDPVDAVPAPILALKLGDGPWMGRGRALFSSDLHLASVETQCTEAGPLWQTWLVAYTCSGGQWYRAGIRLFANQPFVEITESSALCRDSWWCFSVQAGLVPTHAWTHPYTPVPDAEARSHAIDYATAAERSNLGSIQMPTATGIWIPDDYNYFAFLGAERAIAAIGVTGGFWDYPYENQIDIEITPDGDAFFQLSVKAGHRRWLLGAYTRSEIEEGRGWKTPIHATVKHYQTRLDVVKDWVLDWDDVPQTDRPFALATREQLADVPGKVAAFKKFEAYVDMLDPDLPGDFTYYHAGTHRTFEPDHCNDPAVLYVTATDDAERRKQAAFLKDVVMSGLEHRRVSILDQIGDLDTEVSCINVGRGLRPWAALYDFAAAEGMFSEAEAKLARATFAFFAYKFNEPDYWPADHITLRDDHPRSAHRVNWFPRRQHDWSFYNIDTLPHNFHGDYWSAIGCVGITFPTHPNSRRWVERTLEFWECELTQWVFPDGPWLESSTYTLNSMKDYLIYCRMLANAKIRNYFTDERLQRAFRCIAEQLGPDDPQIGGTSLPVMGDGSYPNGFCYVLGWMGGLSREVPAFAAMMNEAWRSTGEYLTEPGRFGLNFIDFLFIDPEGARAPLPSLPSKWYRGLGAILRHAHRTPEEIYLFIKAGVIYSHFHEVEGTFQLWWDSRPICDEYGVQYGTGDDGRAVGEPSMHNCVEVDGHLMAYNKGDFTTFITSDAFDYAVVEAPMQVLYPREGQIIWGFKGDVGPAGWHKRHFLFVKPYYLFIYDDLECPHTTTYHLNVKADGKKQTGNHVHYDGRLGVDLEFLALDLGERNIRHGEYNVRPPKTQAFQPDSHFYHQLQLSIPGAPHQDYATLLVPHGKDIPVTVANDAGTGGACIERDGTTERAFVYPQRRDVRDGSLIYAGQAGSVREANGTLTLIQACGTRIGLEGRLTIDGDGPFVGTLGADGRVTIKASGIARWLTLNGSQDIYVPEGEQVLVVKPE